MIRALVFSVLFSSVCRTAAAETSPGRRSVPADRDPPFTLPAADALARVRSAVVETDGGELVFELLPDEAPWHVANFKYLADRRYYRGTTFSAFHRGYIIQGGTSDPKRRTASYTLPPEFGQRRHTRGVLGMARKPDALNPERRSSAYQFHLLLGRAPHLDGNYTVFGILKSGEEVLERLGPGSVIHDVRVYVRK